MAENEKTCCFIGQRKIEKNPMMEEFLRFAVETLIKKYGISVFLFGSKSEFNDLCYDAVTKLKEKYPHIKRVYVRAEFLYEYDPYTEYLLTRYEETYYPEKLVNAGSAVYVERNFEMINKSDLCVFYYEKGYKPQKRKSGTRIAFEYAISKKKKTYNAATGLERFCEMKSFELMLERMKADETAYSL